MAMIVENFPLVPFDAPEGTVISAILLIATDAIGNHFPSSTPYAPVTAADGSQSMSATSVVLAPGVYTVSLQAVDSANPPNAIGPAALDPNTYTIAAPTTITVLIPSAPVGTVDSGAVNTTPAA